MATREAEGRGLGAAVRQVAEHATSLARLEVELALVEIKRKAAALGLGAGLAVGAALLLLFALGFALAGAAAAIAMTLSVWAALLIVAGGLFAAAVLLGLLAVTALRRGTPPVPQQAIEEAKRTTEALRRGDGRP